MSCIFIYDNYKSQIWRFKNVTSSPLPVFWPLHGKNKDIALEFCIRAVCRYLDHMYSDSLHNLKNLDFVGNYF